MDSEHKALGQPLDKDDLDIQTLDTGMLLFLGTLSLLLSWLLNTSDLLVIIDFSIVLVYPLININIIIIVIIIIIIIIIIILMGSYHHYHYYP